MSARQKIIIILFLSLLPAILWAQEKTTIEILIGEDLSENYDEIRLLAGEISPNEKMQIFENHKMPTGKAAALNILPLAFGSFSQGDRKGQIIAAAGQVLGASLFISGQIINAQGVEDTNNALLLVGTGASIYFSSTVFSILRACFTAWRYSNLLENSLGI